MELEDDMTPGQSLHNSICGCDGWAGLDDESRRVWERSAAGDGAP